MSDSRPRAGLELRVVRAPPFRHAFVAQSFAELSDQIFLVALAWGVLHTTHGFGLGLVLTAWAAPRGAFLLFGGVIVDRSDSRLLAAGVGGALALLDGALALLFLLHATPLAVWLAAGVLLGLLDGLRLPIGYSIIPLVVPDADITTANRWSQLRLWGTLLLGPAVGGLVTALTGPAGGFVTTAALYAAGAGVMLRLPALRAPRDEELRGVMHELAAGLKFIRGHPKLRLILPVFAVANLFVLGLTSVGIPVYVKTDLGAGAQALGALSASFGAGLVTGTIAMGRFPRWFHESIAGLFALFAFSDAALGAVGLAHSLILACIAYALSGFFIGPASTLYQATLQSTTPARYLGRVSGVARAISFGLEPVSATMIGAASRAISAATTLTLGGLAATCADLYAATRGLHHRQIEGDERQDHRTPARSKLAPAGEHKNG
jgi:MFS family permease